jgi:hypothetical protein
MSDTKANGKAPTRNEKRKGFYPYGRKVGDKPKGVEGILMLRYSKGNNIYKLSKQCQHE